MRLRGQNTQGGVEAVAGLLAALGAGFGDVGAVRGERGIHDPVVQAGFAASAALDAGRADLLALLLAAPPNQVGVTMKDQDSQAGRLRVHTGAEPLDEAEMGQTGARSGELRSALDGIRNIRNLTNPGSDPGARPAVWEQRRLLRTVSLLLEAEGLPPSAVDRAGEPMRTGYRTSEGDRAGQVQVRWVGPRGSGARYQEQEQLQRCQAVLRSWGFETVEVRGPGSRRYLEVEAGLG